MSATYDYAWDSDDHPESTQVPVDARPARFALTAPQVLMSGGRRAILLVDPHPAGSWETWMFPYASLVLTSDEVSDAYGADLGILNLGDNFTLADVSVALAALRRAAGSDYDQAILSGVNNVLPELQGTWDPASADYTNYSLKYSATSKSYTAYEFRYSIREAELESIGIPHVWVDIQSLADAAESGGPFQGKAISSNVLDALPFLRSQ